jgi:hypothetical protein
VDEKPRRVAADFLFFYLTRGGSIFTMEDFLEILEVMEG